MSRPLRVLLVEDSESDAKLVANELVRAGHVVDSRRVADAAAMRAALGEAPWDLLICDWSMPAFSGSEAIAIVKELRLDLPFIVVSGTMGEETAVLAMRAGAHDYVLKDKLFRLGPAVERELREWRTRQANREAEAALHRSEARFARLAQSGIVGIAMARSDGTIFEANDALLTLLGYSADDLAQGRLRWADLTPPEWVSVDQRALARVNALGFTPAWEKELLRKDQRRVPVLIGRAPLDAETFILILTDLSERKLLEDQFRQAQKMEAIGRLAGGVAHDFNNLLTVILTYGRLLSSDLKPGDPLHADLSEIVKAGERAAALTKQLLAFSRQQLLEATVVDLNEVLSGLGHMLQRLLGEDLVLEIALAPTPTYVWADRGQIEQVVMNLAVNARDAMPRGGQLHLATAHVELGPDEARDRFDVRPGPHVQLTVRDTGHGMDPATRSRIFEPFFTTKQKDKGTGLGLATVFGIIKQTEGHIGVESELGQGTTFTIHLPRTSAPVRPVNAAAPPPTPRGSETVLLVEDQAEVRTAACRILRRLGYQVLEAGSAGEAIEISEAHRARIHLLLTDVIMPLMSGPELANQLVAQRNDMKVLCMSGFTGEAVAHHGILDSRLAFIQKPLTPETLGKKIREVLGAATDDGGR